MPHLALLPPSATVLSDIAKLISAIIWPAVIIAFIFVLREPLRMLVNRIGGSARSVSIGPSGLSVEFAAAVSEVPTQSSTVLDDLRSPTPQLADSGANTLFDQLAAEAPAPYVLVDLGEGREWLTSRLYLFAVMLSSMRRTRSLVFVETIGGVRGRFLGVAPADQVHWALSANYPWLEADYAEAYANATTQWRTQQLPASVPAAPAFVLDHHGRLSEAVAQSLVYNFLYAVKPNLPVNPGDPEFVNEEVGGSR